MLNFHRALVLLAPSVPRQLRADVAGATGGTQTPVPERLGEGRDETGQPEGGDGRLLSFSPPPPSGPPTSERFQSAPVHPSCRYLLEDRHLAQLLDQWGATS